MSKALQKKLAAKNKKRKPDLRQIDPAVEGRRNHDQGRCKKCE
jgi:hypothetical protein